MLFMAVIAQRMEFEKPVSGSLPLQQHGIKLPLQAKYVAPPVIPGTCNKQSCAAAELWFGGEDDMVTWEPSLKPWLVE
ncbi:TPA: hypothetical protein ACH3X1_004163 [Trebouxia sp. C0004]